jgi:hypothetical protein
MAPSLAATSSTNRVRSRGSSGLASGNRTAMATEHLRGHQGARRLSGGPSKRPRPPPWPRPGSRSFGS